MNAVLAERPDTRLWPAELAGPVDGTHPGWCPDGPTCSTGGHRSRTYVVGPLRVYATATARWRTEVHVEGAGPVSAEEAARLAMILRTLSNPAG